jgi:predicted enzyme related to lactoylglutathione lyase
MINGAHVLFYSRKPEADRAFLRDVIGLRAIDIGQGWMIFSMPPTEAAVHPDDGGFTQAHAGHTMIGALVYFMCEDIQVTVADLAAKGVRCTEIETAPWGIRTTIPLPSGGEVGLYQPTHPTAI